MELAAKEREHLLTRIPKRRMNSGCPDRLRIGGRSQPQAPGRAPPQGSILVLREMTRRRLDLSAPRTAARGVRVAARQGSVPAPDLCWALRRRRRGRRQSAEREHHHGSIGGDNGAVRQSGESTQRRFCHEPCDRGPSAAGSEHLKRGPIRLCTRATQPSPTCFPPPCRPPRIQSTKPSLVSS